MHPIQSRNLYDLAAGAQAAVFAAQAEDDQELRYGLLAAAEHLTAELKRITWSFIEAGDEDDPKMHRVTLTLSEDENVVVEQAAAAAGKSADELLTELIHERIQRAADRITKGGNE